jgi:hypothetical protein
MSVMVPAGSRLCGACRMLQPCLACLQDCWLWCAGPLHASANLCRHVTLVPSPQWYYQSICTLPDVCSCRCLTVSQHPYTPKAALTASANHTSTHVCSSQRTKHYHENTCMIRTQASPLEGAHSDAHTTLLCISWKTRSPAQGHRPIKFMQNKDVPLAHNTPLLLIACVPDLQAVGPSRSNTLSCSRHCDSCYNMTPFTVLSMAAQIHCLHQVAKRAPPTPHPHTHVIRPWQKSRKGVLPPCHDPPLAVHCT